MGYLQQGGHAPTAVVMRATQVDSSAVAGIDTGHSNTLRSQTLTTSTPQGTSCWYTLPAVRRAELKGFCT